MSHNKERTAQPHSWHIGRHQKTPKNMHASGTSAPRGDGGEDGHSSGTSGPIASRDDGAIFLTAAKTQQRFCAPGVLLSTQDMISSQHRVWRDGQTERVCAVYASLTPIRLATKTIRPRERGHTRTRPRAHARQHARRRPRPFYVGIFERLTLPTCQTSKNFLKLFFFKKKRTKKKKHKKKS